MIAEGTSILLTTQYLEEADELADMILEPWFADADDVGVMAHELLAARFTLAAVRATLVKPPMDGYTLAEVILDILDRKGE